MKLNWLNRSFNWISMGSNGFCLSICLSGGSYHGFSSRLLGCLIASIETTKYLMAAKGFTKLATASRCTAVVERVDQNGRLYTR